MPALQKFFRILFWMLLLPCAMAAWTPVSTIKPVLITAGDTGSFFSADATTNTVYTSADSGQTWFADTSTTVGSLSSLTYSGQKIWAGSVGNGVAYSSDGGGTWTVSIQGMIVPPLLTVAPTIYGVVTLPGGQVMLATQKGIYLSTNSATSWGPASTGLPTTGVAPFTVVQPIFSGMLGPNNAVYVGTTSGVYMSSDVGTSWTGVGLAGKTVSKLVGSPSSMYALVYGDDAVYHSMDGSTWTKLAGTPAELSAIAVDPNNAQVVYLGTSPGAIWGSTDGGNDWQQVNGSGLPSTGINALAVSSSGGLTLLAATPSGIYRSSDISSLPAAAGAPLSTVITSDPVTLTGLLAPTDISVTGGSYSINGGTFTSSSGTVVNGAQLRIQLTSSSAYATTTQAVVSVGMRTYTFKVTTVAQTKVTTVTDVLQSPDPSVSVDTTGRLVVTGTPTQPLQLKPGSPANAVVVLTQNKPVTIQSGTQKLVYTDTKGNSELLTQSLNGNTGLQVASGRFQVDSSASGDALPTGSGSSLQTQAGQTTLIVDKSGQQTNSFVQSGKVQYAGSNGSTGAAVYGGETAQIGGDGSLGTVRIGSLDGDKKLPGDPLALSNLDTGAVVPQLSGNLQRLNNAGTLLSVVQAAFDKLYGAGTQSQISYDATLGIVTYTVGGNTYHFTALGQPTIGPVLPTRVRIQDVPLPPGGKPGGAFTISSQGIYLTMATTLAYLGDLDKAVKGIDPAANVKLRSNGSIKVHLGGIDYLTIPGGTASGGGSSAIPGFTLDLSGYLAFIDSSNATQVLFPVFSDASVADQTVKTFDPSGGVTENGDGSAGMALGGGNFKLKPDYNLIAAPVAHAADLFWVDSNGKFYLRYQDGTAQGFTIQ